MDWRDNLSLANTVNVLRSDVLESAFRTFRRRAFDPNRRLDIVFVDTCGVGEGSVDGGGPCREFLRLLLKSMMESQYFVGPQNSRSLALNSLAFSRGNYKMLGMIFAVCLVHGGVGPCVLSRRMFAQLSGLPAPPVDITEVDDFELREQLDNIKRAETLEEARSAMMEASNSLSMLGCPFQGFEPRREG
ncbi:hypothetical protein OYC64_017752 [Pagothenia borchgrevinki]|uniref:HECT domain-containing protein n=1 Tax=Pagothenia borchgrevinki TaxID=8213 RepID=A0ABD2GP10_PAGBO